MPTASAPGNQLPDIIGQLAEITAGIAGILSSTGTLRATTAGRQKVASIDTPKTPTRSATKPWDSKTCQPTDGPAG